MKPSLISIRGIGTPLAIIVIMYTVFGCLYSVITPIFEASDELWHYPMVKYLADHSLALPVQDPSVRTAWRQEGSQPPLYYLIGAALTVWIDTSDLDHVRYINPHANIGEVVPDGNANMIVHNPALESFPWHGTVLAVHLLRLLSVAFSAVTVAMTYLLALELFPGKQLLAFAAAAFTAFNPMFLFISGSVNNDNLSNALASVLLVLIVRLLKRTTRPSIRDLVLIGVLAGAGMLAKFNIGFLLPLIALALALLAYRLHDWRLFVTSALITGGLTVLIAGWWYVRNAQLYGDVTGIDMMIRIAGPRTIPANLAQLWSERHTFLMSYWGFFGGVNVPLPDFVYAVFNGIALIAVVGLGIGIIRGLSHSRACAASGAPSPLRTEGEYQLEKPLSPKGRGVGGEVDLLLSRAVTVLWIVVLFVSLLRWTSLTWASQGRLMFSAIAPLSIWLAVGLWEVGRLVPPAIRRLLPAGTAWFLIVNYVALATIFSTYNFADNVIRHHANDPSMPLISDDSFHEPGQNYPALTMARTLLPSQAHVGEYVQFECAFAFGTERAFSRDWSVFIHLENEAGVIVTQRDIYLGQGQWSTRLLEPGSAWTNRFAIRIPDYAVAPQKLKLYLGFYDLQSGERLIPHGDNTTRDNRVYLGTVQLLPRDSSLNVPNPMNVNFGGEAELVGYDVSSLLMYPGQKVTVTLYWRALHPLTTDYRVFAQIVEPNSTRVFGNGDSMPANWSRPTTTWKPDEIIKDEHTFTINADAPPGTWQIAVGMYQPTAGNGFRRLRVITPDGGEADDFVYLSRIKMLLPPDEF